MPTGYTADITETTTLPEFAMRCARAFGALVTMREDPTNAEIPEEFKPSDYHVTNLKEAEGRLLELRGMSLEQAETMAAAAFKSETADWERGQAENAALLARYERLRGLVREWKAPTADHVGLKEFMDQQLTESIKFDCFDRDKPTKKTAKEWREAQSKSAEWNVSYHREEGAKEVDRARTRTEWVKQLRESLAVGP